VHVVPNGVRRVFPVSLASLDASAGRSYHLAIGGSGRPVSGRLVLPASVPWMVRRAVIEPRPATGKARRYGVEVSADGRLRAADIRPGSYQIRGSIHEPPPLEAGGWGRLIGEFSREFTIAPIPGGVSDDCLDLGELEPTPIAAHSLKIGDLAPDFDVRT